MNAQKSLKQDAQRQLCILLERTGPTRTPGNLKISEYEYTLFVAISNYIRPVYFPKAKEIARSFDVPKYLRDRLGTQGWHRIFNERYVVSGREASQSIIDGQHTLDERLRNKVEQAILHDLKSNLNIDSKKISFLGGKILKDFGKPLAEGHFF